ncbi:MAG: O-acetylhomoserine aminocarboxypropyltransferase/cysteine synthase family protein [Rickettsiales bacterium]
MSHKFETLAIHAGAVPDAATGSVQVPIHQSVSFQFKDAAHAANLFTLKEVGYVYSRLTNPTVSALQDRIAALEGGVGAAAAASGHAIQLTTFFNLLTAGDHIVASHRLYGGTTSQFKNSFKQFGWQSSLVDFGDLNAVKNAITPKTKALYCESFANPAGIISDIEALADIAHNAGIPLIVDNTMASPALLRPIEWGADIVVASSTKYLCGNGSAMGGIMVDSGTFDWGQNDKFPMLNGPEPAYDNMNFHETFGNMAFTFRTIAVGLRDLGACQSPMNAFLTLNGLETLALRMERHSSNALTVAKWLENHPLVAWVNYIGLPNNKYHTLAKKYAPNGQGSVFTFGLKGGYDAAKGTATNLKIFRHVANIGDTRSLVIHPASTTHSQLSSEHLEKAGIGPETLRVSIGLEHADDIMADLDQAMRNASRKNAA